ncbi:MAG TPA: efflux transporter outer membrane subunit [Steroidobacteraceae bacterium]|jgi:multidrug efflux system outer membrane protein|nr:efflux transporter outer membrane subunit [Steroidobacteraceae bacterium]
MAAHVSSVRWTVLAASALWLLHGCTMEPRYRAPALPVPEQWPIPPTSAAAGDTTAAPNEPAPGAAEAATAASLAARDIGWRDFFADPRLQQLIAQALVNNRDLRVAVLNIQLARAQYRVQRSELLPAINATGSYTKEKLPAVETGLPYSVTESFYQAGVGVSSFELDLFGRVRSLTHAALAQYLAQEQARRSAQLSLIAQIANAYLTLASDRELQRLAQQTLKSQEDSFGLTERRHAIGAVSALDLAQAQTTVETARADAARYDGNIAQDMDALALLVGAPVDATLLPQDFEGGTIGLEALPAGLPSTVLLRRPDVLQSEFMLRSANADIGAARAAFFPTISLTAAYGYASPALSGLFKSGNSAWNFSPQATLPLFHGGELVGNLAIARTDRDIAVAQYEKAIQSAFREAADALALTLTLERQRQAQEALVAATQRAYDLSQQRYKAGSDSYLVVLDAQRSYYSAQQGLIATRLAQQNNRVTLYKALGGGWQEHSRGATGNE